MGTHMIGRCKDGHRSLFLKLEDFQGFQSEEEALDPDQADQLRQLRHSISFRSISKHYHSLKACSHLFQGKQVEASNLFNLQRDVIEDGRLCS